MDIYYLDFNDITYFLTSFQQRFFVYFISAFVKETKIPTKIEICTVCQQDWDFYGGTGNPRELRLSIQNSHKSFMKYYAQGFCSYVAYILGMSSKSVLESSYLLTCSYSSQTASWFLACICSYICEQICDSKHFCLPFIFLLIFILLLS